ncbi:succinylglutamate desuccinylase/aspartoacylase domain-containing protein [Halosimplex pelagicum]|uniref:Succinylglutamate desuccinylase/aspartoacylase family protein n=1 Tax=Halosimplex pelagicum TaxID=869886 RepID=A0A7D5TF07_9EURY|nr:succinylglutamate desuccinylase/aspartoacylase family protein [Halosimplex pelagicum]QLH84135.1 succinylglutamate desuccinylase/aspartoacylase family protein [Halosimplex pelagicum]
MRVETLGDGEPEIAVVGGIHGDEPAGVRAVEQFMDRRPEVAEPVKLVIANEEAIERGERYVEADLNRSFPGRADGRSHEIRLAHELGEELRGCVTLALHTTQSYGGMFALVDEVRDLAREICPRLSIDAVVETGHAEGRIFEVAPETIEVECGYQGTDQAAENAEQVVREFLAAAGALPGEETPRQTDLPVFRLGDPVPKTAAEEYEVFVENFEEVLAGERIAAADGEAVVAEEDFHPVLLSAYGYEDVFGYTAERVGTLSD